MMSRLLMIFALLLSASAAEAARQPASPGKCIKNEKFQIVYRERQGSPGSMILVQRLNPNQPPRWCFFKRQSGDFSITGPGDVYYVVGLVGDVLVYNEVSETSQSLAFLDLETRRTLRTQPYDGDAPVRLQPGIVAFSAVTGDGSAETCPQFKAYADKGLGAALVQDAVVTLPSGEMALSGPVRCIPRLTAR